MNLEKPILIITIKDNAFQYLIPEQQRAFHDNIISLLPEFKVLLLRFEADIKLITTKDDLIKLLELKPEDIENFLKLEEVSKKPKLPVPGPIKMD